MLCQLCFEESFEGVTVILGKVDRRRNVEVVQEVGDMQKDRVAVLKKISGRANVNTSFSTDLCDAKQLNGGLSTVQGAFLGVYLLKA